MGLLSWVGGCAFCWVLGVAIGYELAMIQIVERELGGGKTREHGGGASELGDSE